MVLSYRMYKVEMMQSVFINSTISFHNIRKDVLRGLVFIILYANGVFIISKNTEVTSTNTENSSKGFKIKPEDKLKKFQPY